MEVKEEILETAYIQLIDARENTTTKVSTMQTSSILAGMPKDNGKKAEQLEGLKVQFNPSSLKFTANGAKPPKEKKGIANKHAGKQVACVLPTEPSKMSLQIQLVFDRSNYVDSNVQPEVEGLLALIKNPFTRQITFNWGKLYYKGQVNTMSAEYNMFNSSGIPMRANVNFNMELL